MTNSDSNSDSEDSIVPSSQVVPETQVQMATEEKVGVEASAQENEEEVGVEASAVGKESDVEDLDPKKLFDDSIATAGKKDNGEVTNPVTAGVSKNILR